MRPHILYILSDEHSGMAMSHAGDPNVCTPNMDRMASQGVSFTNAYANCPICTPSRGMIFSGRYAHSGPVQYFFDVYKATAPSSATILRDNGYHTAYFGKWHCGVVQNQLPPTVRDDRESYTRWPHRTPEYHRAGFQDWHGFEINNAPFKGFYYHQDETDPRWLEKYQTDALTDMTLSYLESYEQEEPLFLVLSVEPPHFPLEAPEEFMRLNPNSLETRPNFADSSEMREQLATYYAMIENLDWNIGRVLDGLNRLPKFKNNTLTVYFSDHGDFMGSHGVINRKEYPQQESVRIPTIFHLPSQLPAQPNRNDLFSLVDLLPTTLGLINIVQPNHIQGMDFSPAVRNENFTGPDSVLLEMCGNPRWSLDFLDWRALVTDRWKYTYFETGHELLFDLSIDPYEQNNLALSETKQRKHLYQELLNILSHTREPYFDVLMENGTSIEGPVKDVSGEEPGGLAPTWDGLIQS